MYFWNTLVVHIILSAEWFFRVYFTKEVNLLGEIWNQWTHSVIFEQNYLKIYLKHIVWNFFLNLQCLKESYVKALGIGIGFEVGRLDFKISSDLNPDMAVMDTILNLDGNPVSGWKFEEHELTDHCIAVALETRQVTFSCKLRVKQT